MDIEEGVKTFKVTSKTLLKRLQKNEQFELLPEFKLFMKRKEPYNNFMLSVPAMPRSVSPTSTCSQHEPFFAEPSPLTNAFFSQQNNKISKKKQLEMQCNSPIIQACLTHPQIANIDILTSTSILPKLSQQTQPPQINKVFPLTFLKKETQNLDAILKPEEFEMENKYPPPNNFSRIPRKLSNDMNAENQQKTINVSSFSRNFWKCSRPTSQGTPNRNIVVVAPLRIGRIQSSPEAKIQKSSKDQYKQSRKNQFVNNNLSNNLQKESNIAIFTRPNSSEKPASPYVCRTSRIFVKGIKLRTGSEVQQKEEQQKE